MGSDAVRQNNHRERPARRECAAAIDRLRQTLCRSDTVNDPARSVIGAERPVIDGDGSARCHSGGVRDRAIAARDNSIDGRGR